MLLFRLRHIACSFFVYIRRRFFASERSRLSHRSTVFPALPGLCVFATVVNSQDEPPPGKDSVEGIAAQQRCEVQPGGRRGVVEFVGEVEGLQVRYIAH